VALGRTRFATRAERLLGTRFTPSVRNALKGLLPLAFLDGRLFAADGDCLVPGLPEPLARNAALATLLATSVVGLGHDLRRDPLPDLDLLASVRALRPRGAFVPDPLKEGLPVELRARGAGNRLLHATFDWREAAGLSPRLAEGEVVE
jgi:hypothetical protein